MAQVPAQYQGLIIEEQIVKLIVPHCGGKLTFLHPPYGPDPYVEVGLNIELGQLNSPTMGETASLVHAAFNSDNKYSKEIKDILGREGLWAFTGALYDHKKGFYIQDNPVIDFYQEVHMNQSGLERMLADNDSNVRFVPLGYPDGEMTPSQLAKNVYVIGLAGEEGAEKLAKVAEAFGEKPYLTIPYLSGVSDSRYACGGHSDFISTFALQSNSGRRLVIFGTSNWGRFSMTHTGFRGSRAFGVLGKTWNPQWR